MCADPNSPETNSDPCKLRIAQQTDSLSLAQIAQEIKDASINFSMSHLIGDGKTKTPIAESREWTSSDLLFIFNSNGLIPHETAIKIIVRGTNRLNKLPNKLNIKAPVTVIGDTHGQLPDALQVLTKGGLQALTAGLKNKVKYMYVGDFVDRGPRSVELLLLLLSLQEEFPDQIILLRGNHETEHTSREYGLYEECKRKYSVILYNYFVALFKTLPLAAEVLTDRGVILILHGGISPKWVNWDDIIDIERRVEPDKIENTLIQDILWADLMPTFKEYNLLLVKNNKEPITEDEYNRLSFPPNLVRKTSVYFSPADFARLRQVAKERGVNIVLMIRGHQLTNGFEVSQDGLVATAFSASDYPSSGTEGNKAAYIIVNETGYENEVIFYKCKKPVDFVNHEPFYPAEEAKIRMDNKACFFHYDALVDAVEEAVRAAATGSYPVVCTSLH